MQKALQDNIINEQGQKVLKDIYQHYRNKKDDIKKSTQFNANDVFKGSLGQMSNKELFSEEMVAKLNDFLPKLRKQN